MKVMRGKHNHVKKYETPLQRWTGCLYKSVIVFCTLVWFLAVIKVFLLEDRGSNGQLAVVTDAVGNAGGEALALPSSHADARYKTLDEPKQVDSIQAVPAQPAAPVQAVGVLEGTRAPSQLTWPPVLADGTIPMQDGTDTMPLTGIKVPRFWKPTEEANIFETGSMINGKETIFLMIASYRDFQCRETITSAYRKSDHPERLFVGAVDQTVEGDIGCLDIDIPCSQDATQPICKYRDQISIYHMDAGMATGPVTARHVGDRMYRGQYFVMQMDAHCLFINHWDTLIIDQWKSTGNEMAVLSSYLTDIQGSIDGRGDSTRDTRPIMCNSDFEGMMPQRYLRHGSQPEERAVIRTMPMLEPFWAAGFSFSRGHFKLQVPYDGYQPMVFQGEEIAIGIRAFTFGYDFYAPRDSVVFHEYAEKSKRRKKIPMFWENSKEHKGEGQKSLKRSTSIIGMAPDIDPNSWDHTEEKRYGLGNVRPLEQFYKLFLIDTKQRKAVQLCPFVRSGSMHKEFMKYLRPDRLGEYGIVHFVR
jgi:hypothetical protein